MLPRKKLDIGWTDLLAGITSCFRSGDPHAVRRRIEREWSPRNDAVICLSVRSGFDLLLQALALPRGSEILLSAVTIRDMVRIVEEHGLVPVPVDLDMRTLSLDPDSLHRCVSERSRALVVAHLFGSRMPLDEVAAFTNARGLYLIEDCAQAYTGRDYRGHPLSDACMFSFGPIKTNTALGCGVLRIKDAQVLAQMRRLQGCYPVQTRGWFLRRLCKYAGIKLLLTRPGYTVFVAVCRRLSKSHDGVLSAALRGFPGPGLFRKIRRQPGYSLLALLERRLNNFRASSIKRRTATAEAALRRMPEIPRPGSDAAVHTHWVYPIRSVNPDALMRHLWGIGLDATRGASSLFVIDPPHRRLEAVPVEAKAVLQSVLYLPVYPEMPERDLERMALAVTAFEAAASITDPVLPRPLELRAGAPVHQPS